MRITNNYHETMRAVLDWYENKIALMILTTDLSYRQIGEAVGVEASFVAAVAVKKGVRRPRGSGSPAHPRHKPAASVLDK
jgi:hypothetical protein